VSVENKPEPCPFCGSHNTDAEFALRGDGRVSAGCMDCGASGPDAATAAEATEKWNTRAPQEAAADLCRDCRTCEEPSQCPREAAAAEGEAEKPWVIFFENRDVPPEIIGPEGVSRQIHEIRLDSWNCHLYAPAEVVDRLRSEHAAALSQAATKAEIATIDRLTEPMECGHLAANLQPADDGTEHCLVCRLRERVASQAATKAREEAIRDVRATAIDMGDYLRVTENGLNILLGRALSPQTQKE
jgi:Lar family restriction alleviation protein